LSTKVTVNFPVIFRHGAGYDETKLGSLKNGHEEQITGKCTARNSAVSKEKEIENFGVWRLRESVCSSFFVNVIWNKASRWRVKEVTQWNAGWFENAAAEGILAGTDWTKF